MLKRMILIAMLVASPAAATQEYILPTLFDVQGVAADDVLNIREAPTASSEIIGSLGPDSTHVEIVGLDRSGNWGQVNTGERAGWVSMRYLAYRTDVWEPGQLPDGFSCGGTEPFWGFRTAGDGGLIWEEPDHRTSMTVESVLDNGIFRDPRRVIYVEDDHNLMVASVTPKQCNDGMSDMQFGLEVTVLLQSRDEPARMYSGCCRIAPP